MEASKQPSAIPAGLNQDPREIKLCKTCKMQTIAVKESCSLVYLKPGLNGLDAIEIKNIFLKRSTLQYFLNKH